MGEVGEGFRWCAQRPVATSGCGVGSVLALVVGCLGLLERRRLMAKMV